MSKCRMWTKKTTSENANFGQTPFSQSTSKFEQQMYAAKQLGFLLHFLLPRDQNHYSNWFQKSRKTAPQYKVLWVVENQEKANNNLSYRFAAFNKA